MPSEVQARITMKNEIIRIGQIGIRFLLESAETNGSVAITAAVDELTRGSSTMSLEADMAA
jgi:hypothetical protein